MKTKSETCGGVILYDDTCPMCRAYTAGFVHAGWLRRGGRAPLSEALGADLPPGPFSAGLDPDRARHEIPLVDPRTGRVTYGVDALFEILGRRFPLLRFVFRLPGFRTFWKAVYAMISYNRRILAGSGEVSGGFDCAPDFHRGWRAAWFVLAVVISLAVHAVAGARIGSAGLLRVDALLLPAAALAGWLFHGVTAAWLLRGTLRWDYLGHLGVVAVIGSAVLLPLQAGSWASIDGVVAAFGAAAFGLMGFTHLRRCKLLGLSPSWTGAWAAQLVAGALAVFGLFGAFSPLG